MLRLWLQPCAPANVGAVPLQLPCPYSCSALTAVVALTAAVPYSCSTLTAAVQLQLQCNHRWSVWTPITEESYRVSISGCGKTILDSMFAHLQRWMGQSANGGMSFYDSKTCFDAATNDGGLSHTTFVIFLPVRPDKTPETRVKNLGHYHQSVLVEAADGGPQQLLGRKHSGHGPGTITLTHGPAAWVGDALPGAPAFTSQVQASTPRHAPTTASGDRTEEQVQKKRKTAASARTARALSVWATRAEQQKEAGCFPCETLDPETTLLCRRVFATATGRTKHCERCEDDEPGQWDHHRSWAGHSARDYIVRKAAEPGSSLAVGTRVNTCATSAARPVVVLQVPLATGTALEYGAKATSKVGQYQKPAREKAYFKTEKQIEVLTDMYKQVRCNLSHSTSRH